jgi:diacylglycerol kinase family enzyme
VVPSRPDLAGNIQRLGDNLATLTESDNIMPLVVTLGGDGTLNKIKGALMMSKLIAVSSEIPLGNANDYTHQAHSRRYLKDPLKFLFNGDSYIVQARPLQIDILPPEDAALSEPDADSILASYYGVEDGLSFNYFGIGLDGSLAKRFNEKDFQDQRNKLEGLKRLMFETRQSVPAIHEAQTLTITDKNGPRQAVELVISLGSRMAKIIHFGGLNIFDDKAGQVEVSKARLLDVALTLGVASVGHFAKLTLADERVFQVTSEKDFYSQSDGEQTRHQSGTIFSVRFADTTLPVLSNQAASNRQRLVLQ